jgi:hypothetical protein
MTPMSPDIQGTWTVTSYRSGEVMMEPDRRAETLLVVDGDRIAGTVGVNRFAGQLDDDSPFGALAMTRMAGPPDLMHQEDLVLELLQGADTVEVTDDGMFLLRDGLLWGGAGEIGEPLRSPSRLNLVEKLGVHKPRALRIVGRPGSLPHRPARARWRTRITNGCH